MRVGIYYVGNDEKHWKLGALAAAVSKHNMPDVEVVHLTDTRTDEIKGVDTCLRSPRSVPMAVFRMQQHQRKGNWLFIDTDVLIHQDVRHVFDAPFDVALASRREKDGTNGPNDPEVFGQMPYNMGVVFSRNPDFWATVERELLKLSLDLQAWMGDQWVVNQLIKAELFKVKVLPPEYNFPPKLSTGELEDALIAHYKGRRKPMMIDHAFKVLSGIDLQSAEDTGTLPA